MRFCPIYAHYVILIKARAPGGIFGLLLNDCVNADPNKTTNRNQDFTAIVTFIY